MSSITKTLVVMLDEHPDKMGMCVMWGIINKKLWDPVHSSHPCELRVLVQNIENIAAIYRRIKIRDSLVLS